MAGPASSFVESESDEVPDRLNAVAGAPIENVLFRITGPIMLIVERF